MMNRFRIFWVGCVFVLLFVVGEELPAKPVDHGLQIKLPLLLQGVLDLVDETHCEEVVFADTSRAHLISAPCIKSRAGIIKESRLYYDGKGRPYFGERIECQKGGHASDLIIRHEGLRVSFDEEGHASRSIIENYRNKSIIQTRIVRDKNHGFPTHIWQKKENKQEKLIGFFEYTEAVGEAKRITLLNLSWGTHRSWVLYDQFGNLVFFEKRVKGITRDRREASYTKDPSTAQFRLSSSASWMYNSWGQPLRSFRVAYDGADDPISFLHRHWDASGQEKRTYTESQTEARIAFYHFSNSIKLSPLSIPSFENPLLYGFWGDLSKKVGDYEKDGASFSKSLERCSLSSRDGLS